jgi:hypothetical protein
VVIFPVTDQHLPPHSPQIASPIAIFPQMRPCHRQRRPLAHVHSLRCLPVQGKVVISKTSLDRLAVAPQQWRWRLGSKVAPTGGCCYAIRGQWAGSSHHQGQTPSTATRTSGRGGPLDGLDGTPS